VYGYNRTPRWATPASCCAASHASSTSRLITEPVIRIILADRAGGVGSSCHATPRLQRGAGAAPRPECKLRCHRSQLSATARRKWHSFRDRYIRHPATKRRTRAEGWSVSCSRSSVASVLAASASLLSSHSRPNASWIATERPGSAAHRRKAATISGSRSLAALRARPAQAAARNWDRARR
jgi:hypothetical protein